MHPASTTSTTTAPLRQLAPCRVVFLLLPRVHLLDFGGPAQVFYEANQLGANYRVHHCGATSSVPTAQGPVLAGLEPLPTILPGDLVLVPGFDSSSLDQLGFVPRDWLQEAHEAGALLCSVCTAAHALAHAGLLDGRRCTTHWKTVSQLQQKHPRARVIENRLFVRDGSVCTSAGVASGIDLALWLIEQRDGPMVAARVAREIVVYLRRDGSGGQSSIFLDHRTHLHSGVHRVQDWLVAHPSENPTLDQLAKVAGMSVRNLTRAFRRETGTTLKQFSNRLKLEFATHLLRNRSLTIEAVASRCGFADARQLRHLFGRTHGMAPSDWRARHADT